MNSDGEYLCPGQARGITSCPMSSNDPDPVPTRNWGEFDLGTITWWSNNQTELFWHRLCSLGVMLQDEPPLAPPEAVAYILGHLFQSFDETGLTNDDRTRKTRALVRMTISVSQPSDCCSLAEAEGEHERQFLQAPPEW